MIELKWNWVYYPYLDAPNKQEESALKAGYIKVVSKDEADKVIADKDKELRQHKYKYCMAMADAYHLRMMLACDNPESALFKNACRRHRKYLELAEKFKEAK